MSWNLISPAFCVRNYIAGHKSSLLSAAGVTLTFSLFFSLFMQIAVACFLGHASIFIALLPLTVLALTILLAKSTVDEEFRKQPLAQRIAYSLLAGIFPISSRRPAEDEEENSGQNETRYKNSYSELLLLHILHLANVLFWMIVFVILMQTSSAFSDKIGKIEQANGLDASWIIFLGSPIACLLSILCRLAYNQVEPWSLVNSKLRPACCSLACCPLTLRSSFKTVTIEEPEVPETPAAEVEEMLNYLAINRD